MQWQPEAHEWDMGYALFFHNSVVFGREKALSCGTVGGRHQTPAAVRQAHALADALESCLRCDFLNTKNDHEWTLSGIGYYIIGQLDSRGVSLSDWVLRGIDQWMLSLTVIAAETVGGDSMVQLYDMRPLNDVRLEASEFQRLVRRMQAMDEEIHLAYFRVTYQQFQTLLRKVRPYIMHRRNHRAPISAEERLALTLRILSSGMNQTTAAHSYFMGKTTVHLLLRETCDAIYRVLQPEYLATPTLSDWEQISADFWKKWNYPNCLGAIDGKHVVIKAPNNSGSSFRNYKETFSVILLAVVDANYLFRIISTGTNGKQSDGGIFANSTFGRKLEAGDLNIPGPAPLPRTNIMSPHVFVADEAFPLKENLMRPFPGRDLSGNHRNRIHNYRLSRARRPVENAFGILAARWRIFRRPIECSPDTVDKIVMACVCLHNFLRTETGLSNSSTYVPTGFVDTDDRDGDYREMIHSDTGMSAIRRSGNHGSGRAAEIRETYADYFLSHEGFLKFQDDMIYGKY
ncbi:hypothetical protein BV898_18689 [Hypsibius exemplaris]|uniref:DDE Tnp4 domain-containing protein n=1 Tax=Hypsibius exemplaris TaxID=2072580 RepID=A0A9X6NPJ5_HYPEX|nr:hypothetical protein BV898_18689 [Hypsibius exemplaris]